jgi:hypothetical protein
LEIILCLKLRYYPLCNSNTHDFEIAKIMAEFYENTIEDNLAILEQIKTGYLE